MTTSLSDRDVDRLLERFDKTPRKVQRRIIASMVMDMEIASNALRKIAENGGVKSRKVASRALKDMNVSE